MLSKHPLRAGLEFMLVFGSQAELVKANKRVRVKQTTLPQIPYQVWACLNKKALFANKESFCFGLSHCGLEPQSRYYKTRSWIIDPESSSGWRSLGSGWRQLSHFAYDGDVDVNGYVGVQYHLDGVFAYGLNSAIGHAHLSFYNIGKASGLQAISNV